MPFCVVEDTPVIDRDVSSLLAVPLPALPYTGVRVAALREPLYLGNCHPCAKTAGCTLARR